VDFVDHGLPLTHLYRPIQGVPKIHGITSGMGSSYVANKNSLNQPRSGIA
jgi:hypothetical protein